MNVKLKTKTMIKNILFILMVAAGGILSAQTFDLMDKNDVSINGLTHTETDDAMPLSETKFHVKNLTGTTANYTCKVYVVSNPTGAGLQVCYGTDCRTANGSLTGSQAVGGMATIAGGGTDNTFKVAPFTFVWNPGDSAIWKVVVYNVSNPNDSASSTITWKYDNTSSVATFNSIDAEMSIYPNPAAGNININYNFTGDVINSNPRVEVFDVVGKRVATHQLPNTNGKLNLDVNGLKSGVYFYTVYANNRALKTERVIIK